jgi:hypothetical protein
MRTFNIAIFNKIKKLYIYLILLLYSAIIIDGLFLKGVNYCESKIISKTNLRKMQDYQKKG